MRSRENLDYLSAFLQRNLKKMLTDNQEENHLNTMSFLTSLPFHHLLSAESIYSSVVAKYPDLNISNLPKTPNERLKLFREAAIGQTDTTAMPVVLNRYIQANFSENISFENESSQKDLNGVDLANSSENKLEIEWQVIFRDELQGCAEIYRAEMLIFKRLLYKQNEELQSPFELTGEKFPQYLDYKLFNVLTNDQTEMLLINSLAANYKLSISIPGENAKNGNGLARELTARKDIEKADRKIEQNATLLTDRIRGWESYYADEENIDLNSLNNENEPKLRIYSLKLGIYWHRWRKAARLAKFDFDLLETIDDPRAIRFYELTKLLRLSFYNKTQKLPDELRVNYEKFVSLMPLPKFRTKDKIEHQIANIIKPLINAGYIKSFTNEDNLEDKINNFLLFRFGE